VEEGIHQGDLSGKTGISKKDPAKQPQGEKKEGVKEIGGKKVLRRVRKKGKPSSRRFWGLCAWTSGRKEREFRGSEN